LEECSCSITSKLYRNNSKFSSHIFHSVSTRTFRRWRYELPLTR